MEENKTLLEKALSKNNKTDEWTFSEEDKKNLKEYVKLKDFLVGENFILGQKKPNK